MLASPYMRIRRGSGWRRALLMKEFMIQVALQRRIRDGATCNSGKVDYYFGLVRYLCLSSYLGSYFVMPRIAARLNKFAHRRCRGSTMVP